MTISIVDFKASTSTGSPAALAGLADGDALFALFYVSDSSPGQESAYTDTGPELWIDHGSGSVGYSSRYYTAFNYRRWSTGDSLSYTFRSRTGSSGGTVANLNQSSIVAVRGLDANSLRLTISDSKQDSAGVLTFTSSAVPVGVTGPGIILYYVLTLASSGAPTWDAAITPIGSPVIGSGVCHQWAYELYTTPPASWPARTVQWPTVGAFTTAVRITSKDFTMT